MERLTVKEAPLPYLKASGLVPACLRRPAELTVTQMIRGVTDGLPFAALSDLQKALDLPMEKVAQHLGIARATLHRRKAAGKLDQGESDRVLRFARLFARASDVLETQANAQAWLKAPQFGLGGEVPLVYAETEVGAREVEDLLGRIEHSVYS